MSEQDLFKNAGKPVLAIFLNESEVVTLPVNYLYNAVCELRIESQVCTRSERANIRSLLWAKHKALSELFTVSFTAINCLICLASETLPSFQFISTVLQLLLRTTVTAVLQT